MSLDTALFIYLCITLVFQYTHILPPSLVTSALVVGGIAGTLPVLVQAGKALRQKKLTVDLLASIALLFSIFDRQWASVVFIDLMITVARIFGTYTEEKARSAIHSLLKLRPEIVHIKKGKNITNIRLADVHVGDIVLVETGERIPVDGVVLKGEAIIDQSSLTGESMPVFKHAGDSILSSTLNTSGSLLIKTEKVGKDTTFEKIIRLVEEAQSGKATIQTIAERFASWYIVLSLFFAALLFLWTRNTTLVLSVLLVTCADDIAIAVPMAFWAAIGYAAKRGIIIKGGNYLESITHAKVLVCDKTGTLTKGKITVHDVVPFGKNSRENVLRWASYTSVVSEHPVAKAIVSHARGVHKKISSPEKFQETAGEGVVAMYGKVHVVSGNIRLFQREHIHYSFAEEHLIQKYNARGFTTVLVSYDHIPIGFIALADELRPDINWTVHALKRWGIEKTIMLTGDNEYVARRIMEETGFDEYHANLLPEDKVVFIKKHLHPTKKIIMVGDGINDAAALALSDVGIAMGVIGSDTAIESSDIALMKDDFSRIAEVIAIGRYTVTIAKQDFVIWTVVNIIGLVLVFTHTIGPSGAALYNFVTDFFPLINSLRLFRYHIFPTLRIKL